MTESSIPSGAAPDAAERCLVVVHGRVQGVGFRFSTVDAGQRLGLSGWVRNLPDGSVETEFVGAVDTIERMLEWLRVGPPSASVTRLDVIERVPVTVAAHELPRGFQIR